MAKARGTSPVMLHRQLASRALRSKGVTLMFHSVASAKFNQRPWVAGLLRDQKSLRPEVVLSSPYLRAQMTGELIRRAGGLAYVAMVGPSLPTSGFEKKNLGCSIALQRRVSRNFILSS